MDMTSHSHSSDITVVEASKIQNPSECISNQPAANETLLSHNTDEALPHLSDRSEDGDISDDCLTSRSSADDISRLLPSQTVRKQKDVDELSESPPPICTPPSSSCSPPCCQSSTCNRQSCSLSHPPHHHHHHRSANQKRLSSTKSHASFKTDAAHIKEVAGDDCCVHCLLACLFCELLSMCTALGECLACGVAGAGCCDIVAGCCCCCMEAAGDAACTEEACHAVLDCGILEDCCGSSDCLEVCLECCSICFPS
ncbi:myoD family inhibitor isoform X2 [Echeneis naucrates]|uniref:MyoD family inhibitor-like n=1 Tax=Echeneis naucrates TaxID=173247 RepID=A0A665U068_ECHNA|nr:myoD family inhibitor-like isoform X2 [Echeneis naucrates]